MNFPKGLVYYDQIFAGTIVQKEGLYIFTYDTAYLNQTHSKPISLTLPLRAEPYAQKTMIPFFDGLIPEGWLLNIITENWKIDPRDRMQLLLLACQECIGNIRIIASQD